MPSRHKIEFVFANLLAAILTVGLAHAGAVQAEPPVPQSTELSATQLYRQCEQYLPSCYVFINQVYDWMLGNESKVGHLCDITNDANVHMSDRNGKPLARTPADMIANYYLAHSNQTWFSKASARDAVIWMMQGEFMCQPGYLIAPGESGFPSPMGR